MSESILATSLYLVITNVITSQRPAWSDWGRAPCTSKKMYVYQNVVVVVVVVMVVVMVVVTAAVGGQFVCGGSGLGPKTSTSSNEEACHNTMIRAVATPERKLHPAIV